MFRFYCASVAFMGWIIFHYFKETGTNSFDSTGKRIWKKSALAFAACLQQEAKEGMKYRTSNS